MGLNILNTDLESRKENENDQSLATLDLGVIMALGRKFSSGRSLALQIGLHYAPYNWSANLQSEVGTEYAVVGLAYGF